MKIVLIEPDKILATTYAQQLSGLSLDVTCAQNAQNAVHAVDSVIPDLVVLEPKLPGHSGMEFLHEFRSYEDWASIPVIVYSSIPEYSFGVDSSMWQKFGVVRYLDKSKISAVQLAGIIKSTKKISL